MIMTTQDEVEVEVNLCELCDECGFLNDSQSGVLRKELGLMDIIENQKLFMCHKHLKAFSGSENTGSKDYVAEKQKLNVCTGYVQSLFKSGIPPQNRSMALLMMSLKKIDPRIMTINDTLKYHDPSNF